MIMLHLWVFIALLVVPLCINILLTIALWRAINREVEA